MEISSINYNSLSTQFQFSTNTIIRALSSQKLEPEEIKQVEALKKRDAEVRRHEQAHLSAAGQYASGTPQYEYAIGPDGKRYAIGGEVKIDTSEVPNNPDATIRKAQTIKRAALAPADPSGKDRQLAAEAARMEAKARQEMSKQKEEDIQFYNQNGEKSPPHQQPTIIDIII